MSFVCNYCSKSFTKKICVKLHIVNKVCLKKVFTCFCGKTCTSPAALRAHQYKVHYHSFRKVHDTIPLHFENSFDFFSWKERIERETASKFVKNFGSRILKNGSKKSKYVCHRSGWMRWKTTGRQRAERRKGSCKINNFCTAFITIEERLDGTIVGEFCGSHCNHSKEINYMALTQMEKEKITDDLKKCVSFDRILDEIRRSLYHEETHNIARINLLTKAELRNMAHQHKISFSERFFDDDVTCIDILVKEYNDRLGFQNPIKFYQSNGVNSHDFILIIMSETQKQILRQFGHTLICIDSTSGIDGFDFHLTTLSTLDDSNLGVPSAYCISNKHDDSVLTIFFSIIRKECGKLRPSVLMCDDFPNYMRAWRKVMDVPKKLFLGVWHVDNDWRQGLNEKIETDECEILKSEIYKTLRVILMETNGENVSKMLNTLIEQLYQDENTRKFGSYIENQYAKHPEKWSYAFRKDIVSINANMRLEAMHRVLKNGFLKGLSMQRLDHCVFQLIKLSRDRTFHLLTDTSDLRSIKEEHELGLRIPFSDIILKHKLYEIKSQSDSNLVYFVRETNVDCSCHLKCRVCDICCHMFSCSCIDNFLSVRLCKHIHAVKMFETQGITEIVKYEEDSILEVPEHYEDIMTVIEEIEIPAYGNENSPIDPKNEIIESLSESLRLLENNTYEPSQYETCLELARNIFELLSSNSKLESLGQTPVNERKLFSVENINFKSTISSDQQYEEMLENLRDQEFPSIRVNFDHNY